MGAPSQPGREIKQVPTSLPRVLRTLEVSFDSYCPSAEIRKDVWEGGAGAGEQMGLEATAPRGGLREGEVPGEAGTVTKLQVKTFFTLPPPLLF